MALNDRMRQRLSSELEDGEAIADALRGHVGELKGGGSIIGLTVLALTAAAVEGRILLLTDRRVIYLHTGLYRRARIEHVLGVWPIGAAPVRILQLEQRGKGQSILEIDGIEKVDRAGGGPDGTVTEVRHQVSEQMIVAQPTLEEISLITAVVERAAGR